MQKKRDRKHSYISLFGMIHEQIYMYSDHHYQIINLYEQVKFDIIEY
jgi:hypothetical protein